MALNLSAMRSTFAALVNTAPQTLTFGNDIANCLRTELTASRRMNEYGGDDTYSFSVMVVETAMTTWPKKGDTVQFSGEPYRVLQIVQDPLGTSRRIDLGGLYE